MTAMLEREEWKAFSDFLALIASGLFTLIGLILALAGSDPAMQFHGCVLLGAAGLAFTNYGVSVGLQSVGAMQDRVMRLNAYFETYRSGDEYDRAAITHVMACSSHFPGLLLKQEH